MSRFCARTVAVSLSQAVLQNWEKISLAGAASLVAVVLATTHWTSGFAGTPDQMRDTASRVERELLANPWPAAALQQFAVIDFNTAFDRTWRGVEPPRFAYSVAPSPKLYVRRAPAEDPHVMPVASLRAIAGRFPLSIYRSVDERKDPKGAIVGKNNRPRRDTAIPAEKRLAPSPKSIPMPQTGEEVVATEVLDSRGVRFVCVTGVVNVHRQLDDLYRALRLEMPGQSARFLDYVSFRIQRQRAILGPDPWAGNWHDLDIHASLNLLTNEAAQWEIDLVAPQYINEVFTSPLPQRLDVAWTPELAGHPAIPTLTDEDLLRPAIPNAPSPVNGRGNPPLGGVRQKQGYFGLQPNAAKQRQAATAQERSMFNPPGFRNFPDAAHGLRPSAVDSGSESVPALFADVQLFRFFDFEVEPEDCYRYRVQLEIANPNFGAPRVVEPGVAQGETRHAPWSEPTPPVAIDRDAEYFLTRLARRGQTRVGAGIAIYQWRPNVGTIAQASLKPRFGQFVGGKAKTELFEIAVPQLTERELTFATREVLIDAVSASLSHDDRTIHKDLRLTPGEWSDLVSQGKLDRAIVINQFGAFEQIAHASDNPRLATMDKKLDSERKPFLEPPVEQISNQLMP